MEGSFQNELSPIQTNHHVFGMWNSLATFQSMMDSIFIEEIEDSITIVYMDDILIYATTPELLEK